MNRTRVLEAAAAAFGEPGADTSMKAIARALRSWMDGFIDYILTKHGLAEALPTILASTDGLRTHSRDLLRDAIARLLAAGVEASAMRADVDPNDVLIALGGFTLIADNEHQRALASRLCDLLVDALTAIL